MSRRSPKLPFFVSAEDPPARQQILIEGLRLFTEKGLCETTVRDIADATGYTNPALYRHFEGKDALASFLFRRCYERMIADVQKALSLAASGQESMRAFVSAMLQLYAESPPALLFISDNIRRFWPGVPPRMRRVTLLMFVREILAPGVRAGTVDEVEIRAATVVGALQQVFRMLYLELIDGPPDRWVEPLTNTLVALMQTDVDPSARSL